MQWLKIAAIIYWVTCLRTELVHLILLSYKSIFQSPYNILDEYQLRNKTTYLRGSADAEIHGLPSIQPRLSTSVELTPLNNDIRVPLIIHRMWKDENIPELWSTSFHHCEEFYKQRNWTTMLWTDGTIRTFLAENYAPFLSTFDSYPYDIQRVDSARYFILYHFGGVYLDLDVGCRKDKDITDILRFMELMQIGSILPLTDPIGVSNDVMFASKGNEFFRQLIEALPDKNRWFGLPYLTVLFSTGPMFLSLAYTNYSQANEEVLALSPTLYSKTDARFFRHFEGSSWHSNDAKSIKWLTKNRWVVSVVLLNVGLLARRNRTSVRKRRASKPHRLSV